jgi:Contractile injection system tube protein/LysM domain
MAVTKAAIEIEKGSDIAPGDRIECMFNPSEFTVTKGAHWINHQVQGRGQPEMRFVSATSGSFDLNLMFDTTQTGASVSKHTEVLLRLTEPNKNLPSADARTKRPPFVWFSWGEWRSFKAFVSSVSVSFTYFASDGTPLRASASVSFMQPAKDDAWPLQNPTSHTPAPHRVHSVRRGESLDRIASIYYSSPTEWRAIADANHVTDPIRIEPGMMLVIPERAGSDG